MHAGRPPAQRRAARRAAVARRRPRAPRRRCSPTCSTTPRSTRDPGGDIRLQARREGGCVAISRARQRHRHRAGRAAAHLRDVHPGRAARRAGGKAGSASGSRSRDAWPSCTAAASSRTARARRRAASSWCACRWPSARRAGAAPHARCARHAHRSDPHPRRGRQRRCGREPGDDPAHAWAPKCAWRTTGARALDTLAAFDADGGAARHRHARDGRLRGGAPDPRRPAEVQRRRSWR